MPKRRLDITLSPRDEQILVILYSFRYLTVEILWHLMNPDGPKTTTAGAKGRDAKIRPRQYGFGREALYKRLRRLQSANLIARQYLYHPDMDNHQGAPAAVYTIETGAAWLVSLITGDSTRMVRSKLASNQVAWPYLHHAVGISRFRAVLELACLRSEGEAQLIDWIQGLALKDRVYVKGQDTDGRWYSVYPDAAFRLQTGNTRPRLYFLEYDRGTVPLTTSAERTNIKNKLIGYFHYQRSGSAKTKFARLFEPDDPGAETRLQQVGSTSRLGFTVLFLMPDSRHPANRISNSLVLLKSLGPGFATTSRFWFAPEKILNLDMPQRFLSHKWRTGINPERCKTLLD